MSEPIKTDHFGETGKTPTVGAGAAGTSGSAASPSDATIRAEVVRAVGSKGPQPTAAAAPAPKPSHPPRGVAVGHVPTPPPPQDEADAEDEMRTAPPASAQAPPSNRPVSGSPITDRTPSGSPITGRTSNPGSIRSATELEAKLWERATDAMIEGVADAFKSTTRKVVSGILVASLGANAIQWATDDEDTVRADNDRLQRQVSTLTAAQTATASTIDKFREDYAAALKETAPVKQQLATAQEQITALTQNLTSERGFTQDEIVRLFNAAQFTLSRPFRCPKDHLSADFDRADQSITVICLDPQNPDSKDEFTWTVTQTGDIALGRETTGYEYTTWLRGGELPAEATCPNYWVDKKGNRLRGLTPEATAAIQTQDTACRQRAAGFTVAQKALDNFTNSKVLWRIFEGPGG